MTQTPPTSGSHVPVPTLVAALEGACLGLFGLLFAIGGAMAAGLVGAPWSGLHLRAADVLVLASVALIVAGYASGVHRGSPTRWWVHCLLLVTVLAMYIVGDAAVRDPDGAAGREHIGAVIGVTPGPMLTLLAHVAGGLLLALGAGAFCYRLLRRAPSMRVVRARMHALSGGLAVIVAGVSALAWPVAPRTPMLSVATVPTPPWPAMALVPLEARMPLTLALGLVVLVCGALALVPVVDRASRPPWVRRFTTSTLVLILLTFIALMLVGALVPETEHIL